MKKTPIQKARSKVDKLLTPWVIRKQKLCECCGSKATVAHHWIEKSRSSNLRYDFRNLIALCQICHTKIHNRFGNSVTGAYDTAVVIIKKRGKKWKETMDIEGTKIIKADRQFYEENYERISKEL